VVYAATRAIVAGQLPAGEAFPSVRTLSRDLKINPNTAHKVITQLLNDGLLESRPGIGTVVAELPRSTATQRTDLLGPQIEELVVEAKRLSIDLDDVTSAISRHWKHLTTPPAGESK
jgi:GntR family transcriptional regulator